MALIVDMAHQPPIAAKLAIVLDVQILIRVEAIASGIVKDGAEVGSRKLFFPRTVHTLNLEIAVGEIGEELSGAIVIYILRDAVVGRGTIVFRKEKLVVPVAVVVGA